MGDVCNMFVGIGCERFQKFIGMGHEKSRLDDYMCVAVWGNTR